jgi:hypothetical protein
MEATEMTTGDDKTLANIDIQDEESIEFKPAPEWLHVQSRADDIGSLVHDSSSSET